MKMSVENQLKRKYEDNDNNTTKRSKKEEPYIVFNDMFKCYKIDVVSFIKKNDNNHVFKSISFQNVYMASHWAVEDVSCLNLNMAHVYRIIIPPNSTTNYVFCDNFNNEYKIPNTDSWLLCTIADYYDLKVVKIDSTLINTIYIKRSTDKLRFPKILTYEILIKFMLFHYDKYEYEGDFKSVLTHDLSHKDHMISNTSKIFIFNEIHNDLNNIKLYEYADIKNFLLLHTNIIFKLVLFDIKIENGTIINYGIINSICNNHKIIISENLNNKITISDNQTMKVMALVPFKIFNAPVINYNRLCLNKTKIHIGGKLLKNKYPLLTFNEKTAINKLSNLDLLNINSKLKSTNEQLMKIINLMRMIILKKDNEFNEDNNTDTEHQSNDVVNNVTRNKLHINTSNHKQNNSMIENEELDNMMFDLMNDNVTDDQDTNVTESDDIENLLFDIVHDNIASRQNNQSTHNNDDTMEDEELLSLINALCENNCHNHISSFLERK